MLSILPPEPSASQMEGHSTRFLNRIRRHAHRSRLDAAQRLESLAVRCALTSSASPLSWHSTAIIS